MFSLKKYLIILVASLGITGFICYSGWIKSGEDEDTAIPKHPVNANVTLSDVDFTDSSGKDFQLENLKKGKILLVYLLDGCGACSFEAATLSDVQKQPDFDTKIWGIVRNSGKSVSGFQEQDSNIPIIIDKGNKLLKQLRIKSYPYNLLIKDGIIVKKWVGIRDEKQLKDNL